MAKARISLKLDKAGISNLLHSQEMLDATVEVGEMVASRAGIGYEVVPQPARRASRAMSNVIDPEPGALSREAQTGNLARAVSSMTEPYQWKL